MGNYEVGLIVGSVSSTVFLLLMYFVVVRPAAKSCERKLQFEVDIKTRVIQAFATRSLDREQQLQKVEAELRSLRGAQAIDRWAREESYAQIDQPQGKYGQETNAIIEEQRR